ncbi:MAG: hypothetical protein M3Y13_09900 [Armatimonadota bacterium]|nr:hypothetical protein [Armatimonadota bacterium]
MVGYFGDDPGIPIIAPAGSIAVFSSTVFHRSGFNGTNRPRRISLTQYSSDRIMTEDGSRPLHHSDPFLKNGEIVFSEENFRK